MSFEITGKLHKKYETEQKSQTFQAREFVIMTQDGQYSNYIKFQLTQDRCGLIDGFEEGQDINVHFDLRGREWQDKYFTNLNAWRIQAAGAGEPSPAGNEPQGAVPPLDSIKEQPSDKLNDDPFDDLPF